MKAKPKKATSWYKKKVDVSDETLKKLQNKDGCANMLKESGHHKEWFCLVSDPYHLQIDIDDVEQEQPFRKMLTHLEQRIKIKGWRKTVSKSGNLHFIVELEEPMSAFERILLQACLGSDPRREMLSYFGLQAGNSDAILLIEKREEWPGLEAHMDPYVDGMGGMDVIDAALAEIPMYGGGTTEVTAAVNKAYKYAGDEEVLMKAVVYNKLIPAYVPPPMLELSADLTTASYAKTAHKKWKTIKYKKQPEVEAKKKSDYEQLNDAIKTEAKEAYSIKSDPGEGLVEKAVKPLPALKAVTWDVIPKDTILSVNPTGSPSDYYVTTGVGEPPCSVAPEAKDCGYSDPVPTPPPAPAPPPPQTGTQKNPVPKWKSGY